MVTFISRSAEETLALGDQWGREARAGWVIGLSGELGAGKTQLVKGLARGLGYPGRVHSPTFALVNTYAGGRLPLVHLDLYRLETVAQIAAAGLEEYLQETSGVTVIEWAERWFGPADFGEALPPARPAAAAPRAASGSPAGWRRVRIDTLSDTERRVVYEDSGA
jgi:tRNA threonylcarbamoyladenosine biosynthesis protein TsaE